MPLVIHEPQELDNGKGDPVSILAASCPHCGHTARHAIARPADETKKARAEATEAGHAVIANEFPKGKCPVCRRPVDEE